MQGLSSLICFLLALAAHATTAIEVKPGILGTSVTVECSLPATSTLLWDHSDGSIIAMGGFVVSQNLTRKYSINRRGTDQQILIIHDLGLEDDKVFRCYDLLKKSVNESIKVNVLVPPSVFTINAPNAYVNEGTLQILQCIADGAKPLPDIVWTHISSNGTSETLAGELEDTLYANGTGRRVSTLRLHISRDHYKSQYDCEGTVSIIYQERKSVTLDVHLLPTQPEISGYSGSFDHNEVLEVTCTSNGSRPTADIAWTLDGKSVGDSAVIVKTEPDQTSQVVGKFRRKLTHDMDGSVLACFVSNQVNKDLKLPPLTQNITLHVSYAPVVTMDNRTRRVHDGENVTIPCLIDAKPHEENTSIYWTRDNITIDRSLFSEYLTPSLTTSILQIPYISRFSAGSYQCHASNRLGESKSQQLQVIVFYPPTCRNNSLMKYAVKLGKSVEMTCAMVANPSSDVTMTWKYTNATNTIKTRKAFVDKDNEEHVYGKLELLIRNEAQYGTLECTAVNSEGRSGQSCFIEIVEPGYPDVPENCTIEYVTDDVERIFCVEGFHGGSTPTFVLQAASKDAQSFQTVSSRAAADFVLRRNDVSENTTFIRVCAYNQEFSDIKSCTDGIEFHFNSTETATPEPVSLAEYAEESHLNAYIAGGVCGFVALLFIVAVIVIIVLKKRKQHSKRKATKTTNPLYRKTKSQGRSKTLQLIRRDAPSSKPITPDVPRRNYLRDPEADVDLEHGHINIVASTPVYTFSSNRKIDLHEMDTLPFSPVNNPSINTQRGNVYETIPTDKLNVDTRKASATTTFFTQSEDDSKVCDYLDEVIEHHGRSLSRESSRNSIRYTEADIAAVLDQSTLPVKEKKDLTVDKPHSNIAANDSSGLHPGQKRVSCNSSEDDKAGSDKTITPFHMEGSPTHSMDRMNTVTEDLNSSGRSSSIYDTPTNNQSVPFLKYMLLQTKQLSCESIVSIDDKVKFNTFEKIRNDTSTMDEVYVSANSLHRCSSFPVKSSLQRSKSASNEVSIPDGFEKSYSFAFSTNTPKYFDTDSDKQESLGGEASFHLSDNGDSSSVSSSSSAKSDLKERECTVSTVPQLCEETWKAGNRECGNEISGFNVQESNGIRFAVGIHDVSRERDNNIKFSRKNALTRTCSYTMAVDDESILDSRTNAHELSLCNRETLDGGKAKWDSRRPLEMQPQPADIDLCINKRKDEGEETVTLELSNLTYPHEVPDLSKEVCVDPINVDAAVYSDEDGTERISVEVNSIQDVSLRSEDFIMQPAGSEVYADGDGIFSDDCDVNVVAYF